MSGRYAEFVETEVLPLVEKQYSVRLTKDPDGARDDGLQLRRGRPRSSMAWYRPDLYHRVLSYSGTFVNQQWPHERRDAARRVGVPRAADPEQPGEADPHLDAGRRPRSLQPERDARRDARLGRRQRAHGAGCSPTRAITTSSSSRATPATAIARRSSRRFPKRWSGCGADTRRRSEGDLTVDSTVGVGRTFTLTPPALRKPVVIPDEHTENCFSQFRRAGSFTRRPRSNARGSHYRRGPRRTRSPAQRSLRRTQKKRDFGIVDGEDPWLVQPAQHGRQFSACSPVVHVSA